MASCHRLLLPAPTLLLFLFLCLSKATPSTSWAFTVPSYHHYHHHHQHHVRSTSPSPRSTTTIVLPSNSIIHHQQHHHQQGSTAWMTMMATANNAGGGGGKLSRSSSSNGGDGGGVRENIDTILGVVKGYINKATEAAKDWGSEENEAAIAEWRLAVNKHAKEGVDFNVQGQLLALPPVILVGLILIGRLPYIADLAQLLCGPGFILAGAFFAVTGIYELGKFLSPWPQPVDDATLQTEGAYALVRHPIYAGMIMFGMGLSVTTEEFDRMFLTVLLFLIIEKKVEYEEDYLRDKFPGSYEEYSKTVKKYIPFIY